MANKFDSIYESLKYIKEDSFNITTSDGAKGLSKFEFENEQDEVVDVINPQAENEEELQEFEDSFYLGKYVAVCDICANPSFLEKEDISNPFTCPYCFTEGATFQVVGKVESAKGEETLEESNTKGININSAYALYELMNDWLIDYDSGIDKDMDEETLELLEWARDEYREIYPKLRKTYSTSSALEKHLKEIKSKLGESKKRSRKPKALKESRRIGTWKKKGYTLEIDDDYDYGHVRFQEMMKNYGGEWTDNGFTVPSRTNFEDVEVGDYIIGSYGNDLEYYQVKESDIVDGEYEGKRFGRNYYAYIVKSTGGTERQLKAIIDEINHDSNTNYIRAELTDLDGETIDKLSGIHSADRDASALSLEETLEILKEVGFDFGEAEQAFFGGSIKESKKTKKVKALKESKKSKKQLNEELKIITNIRDYEPWSGAKDTWYKILDADKVDELESYLEAIYPEGITMTQLNDILWFDGEQVLLDLGIIDEEEYNDLTESKKLKESKSLIYTSVDKLSKFLKEAVENLKGGGNGTHYSQITENLYSVVGVEEGHSYDADDEGYMRTPDGYVICAKVAYNPSSLQSDYELDWHMPSDVESGDVWDTNSGIKEDENFMALARYHISEAKSIERLATRGKLIVESKKLKEESSDTSNEKLEYISAEEASKHVLDNKGKITVLGNKGYLGVDFYSDKDGNIVASNFELGPIVRTKEEFNLLKHLKSLEEDGFKFVKSDDIKNTRDLHINNSYKVESKNKKVGKLKAKKTMGLKESLLLETGEWEEDEEGIAWKKELLNLIRRYTTARATLSDIKGFDKYQGPYAYIDGVEFWTDAETGGLAVNKDGNWYIVNSKNDWRELESGELEPISESKTSLKESTTIQIKGDADIEVESEDNVKVDVEGAIKDQVIVPLSDEEQEEVEELKDITDELDDAYQFEDVNMSKLVTNFLKENFSDVRDYKVSRVRSTKQGLVVEGLITYKNKRTKKTVFTFENFNKNSRILKVKGDSDIFGMAKAFILEGVIKNKKVIPTSLKYNFKQTFEGVAYKVFGKALLD